MIQFVALLAFFAVPASFAQTTFVSHRSADTRTETVITGQSGEGALRDLQFLAEMLAHPGKLTEGNEADIGLGRLRKWGEGIRVTLSAGPGEILLDREGSTAVLNFRGEPGWKLYSAMSTTGWQNFDLGLNFLTSPSGAISCDRGGRNEDWVDCTLFLDHVVQ